MDNFINLRVERKTVKLKTNLTGKKYAISRQYDATDRKDLLQIVFILKKLKDLILAN